MAYIVRTMASDGVNRPVEVSLWRLETAIVDDIPEDLCALEFPAQDASEIEVDDGFSDTAGKPEPNTCMKDLQNLRWKKVRARQEAQRQKIDLMNKARAAFNQRIDESGDDQLNIKPRSTSADLRMSLGREFLHQCTDCLPKIRPHYDKLLYDISMLIHLSSAKSYKVLKQILRLPSVSSLYRHYGMKMQEIKEKLVDLNYIIEQIDDVKQQIRELGADPSLIRFTLAVDAFSFRSFTGATCSPGTQTLRNTNEHTLETPESKTSFKNGFLFLLIAHDYRVPVKIVHLMAASSGSYNKTVAEVTKTIITTATEKGLRIWCRATDGDPGVSKEHSSFYSEFILGRSCNFLTLMRSIYAALSKKKDLWIPISDPLHVFKNMRARLLSHNIKLYPGGPCTNIESLRTALALGPALNDESQLGKMRDGYVLALFTFDNVATLLKKGHYVHACFLFPFSCWIAVIFSTSIDLNFRLFLVELSFQILSDWFDFYGELAVYFKEKQESTEVTFCEPSYVKRMLNTLAAFGVSLIFGAENIRMDALGTHMVENAIGIARATSSDPRYERIVTTYTHGELRKSLARDLGLTLHVRGRINAGGCKVDPDYAMPQTLLSKPSNWKIDKILELMRGLCCDETSKALETKAAAFSSEIATLASCLDAHEYTVNDAANSSIIARLIKFK